LNRFLTFYHKQQLGCTVLEDAFFITLIGSNKSKLANEKIRIQKKWYNVLYVRITDQLCF
jgi:hypothetical protein